MQARAADVGGAALRIAESTADVRAVRAMAAMQAALGLSGGQAASEHDGAGEYGETEGTLGMHDELLCVGGGEATFAHHGGQGVSGRHAVVNGYCAVRR